MAANLLTMLKVDIGVTSTVYDERLTQVLAAAEGAIAREGGVLNLDRPEDCQLVVMYAAWLWRRRDAMEEMPRMVRWALNNNVFGNAMAGGAP